MAGLYWLALAFFLSAGNTADAYTQTELAIIVNSIIPVQRYGTQGMFSLAVRIPNNPNLNLNQALQAVYTSDPVQVVEESLNRGEVYIGTRVVAAKPLRGERYTDHAESRVVDQLDNLYNMANDNDNDMLLFYVFASPCVDKCSSSTHRQSILERIKRVQLWSSYAVVFSTIFTPTTGPPSTEQARRDALQRLGTSVGLNNMFRCQRVNYRTSCNSCSNGNQVANICVSDQGLQTLDLK